MKIRLTKAELINADGRTDRHVEAGSFFAIFIKRLKTQKQQLT
jgi:hypothetical protein